MGIGDWGLGPIPKYMIIYYMIYLFNYIIDLLLKKFLKLNNVVTEISKIITN